MRKAGRGDHATIDSLSEFAHESVDHVAKSAGRAEERIRHGAANVEARVMKAGKKARKRSDDTLDSINDFVRANPLASVGLVFAAGALLFFLRRRS